MVLKILITISLLMVLIFLRELSVQNKKSLEKAQSLFEKGKIAKAEKILLYLAKNKDLKEASKAMSFLGVVYYFKKEYEEAKKIFKRIYNMKAANKFIKIKSLHFLALIAEKEERYDLAINYVVKFQEIKKISMPFKKIIFEKQVLLILARCYFYKGDEFEAIECLKKCLDGEITKNDEVSIKMQLGRFYLELANYLEAEKYFKEIKKQPLERLEKVALNYHLSMLFLGKNDYNSLFKVMNDKDFLQGETKNRFFGFYSSAMFNIENKDLEKARDNFQQIFKIIENKEVDVFYKFFHCSILAYYGLAKLGLTEGDYASAEENFRNIETILKKISKVKFNSFIQRANINFFKILVFSELGELYYNMKDIEMAKDKIKEIDSVTDNLTEKEKEIINHKSVGNKGSVLEKSKILKMKLIKKD